MNRRDFLKTSVLASTIFFPIVSCKKDYNEWFIAVDGSPWFPETKGTIDDPLSFEGLRQNVLDRVQPGDTIYFREGYYRLVYDQPHRVLWEGLPGKPVRVKPYRGEKVILDGSINIAGNHQWWYGFENLDTRWLTRESQETGSNPTDIGPVYDGFIVDGDGTKIINCEIHDNRQGVRAIGDAYLTVENCRIWNNGWNAPDRGHGHGIYANVGPITIKNNWIGKGYSEWGVHVYGASTESLVCKKNKLENCMLYARSVRNLDMSNNEVKINIEDARRFVGFGVPLEGGEIVWDHNKYIDEREGTYNFTSGMTFEEWQNTWGFDLNSTYRRTNEVSRNNRKRGRAESRRLHRRTK
jgi:hypothetical protein